MSEATPTGKITSNESRNQRVLVVRRRLHEERVVEQPSSDSGVLGSEARNLVVHEEIVVASRCETFLEDKPQIPELGFARTRCAQNKNLGDLKDEVEKED